jgi:hypothetical protein
VQEHDRQSSQARETAAALRVRLGRCYCGIGRADEALPLFRQAAEEIRSLCADFPSNEPYWNLVRYFHREITSALQAAHQPEPAQQFVRDLDGWLNKVAAKFSSDQQVQAQVTQCREELVVQARK